MGLEYEAAFWAAFLFLQQVTYRFYTSYNFNVEVLRWHRDSKNEIILYGSSLFAN